MTNKDSKIILMEIIINIITNNTGNYKSERGVGNSTTVINLAASLSIMGQSNLVIDLDPQGNATTGLGKNNNDEDKNVYNLLIKKINIENVIQRTDNQNLDLIGSHVNLSGLEF